MLRRRGRGGRRLASVATGAALLHGCVTYPVEPVQPVVDGARGWIAVRAGRPGMVIGAPHGTSDPRTGDIAAELARRTGFGLVVASGFAREPDGQEGPGRRYQVNRPFEGVPGKPPSQEIATEDARHVYEMYEQRVREAAQGFLIPLWNTSVRTATGCSAATSRGWTVTPPVMIS